MCPNYRSENSYIARYATDAWVVVDFVEPSVERWSVGLVYHLSGGKSSQIIIAMDNYLGNSLPFASHTTTDGIEVDYGPFDYIPNSVLDAGPGQEPSYRV